MNELQEFRYLVVRIQSELHNHEYTLTYDRRIAETVLKEIKARAFVPDFDNRTYRRALDQAVKTLGTAEEHFAALDRAAEEAEEFASESAEP
jgi:hypothetical protein